MLLSLAATEVKSQPCLNAESIMDMRLIMGFGTKSLDGNIFIGTSGSINVIMNIQKMDLNVQLAVENLPIPVLSAHVQQKISKKAIIQKMVCIF